MTEYSPKGLCLLAEHHTLGEYMYRGCEQAHSCAAVAIPLRAFSPLCLFRLPRTDHLAVDKKQGSPRRRRFSVDLCIARSRVGL